MTKCFSKMWGEMEENKETRGSKIKREKKLFHMIAEIQITQRRKGMRKREAGRKVQDRATKGT